MKLPKNLRVARQAKLLPLSEVAAKMGIGKHLLEPYGEGVAEIRLEGIERAGGMRS
jgi:formate--tetrahydrofolate ligase